MFAPMEEKNREEASELSIAILIVDDDEIYRELLVESIDEPGVGTEVAESGEEALSKLNATSYDILITDLNMPGMDGLSLLGRAREKYPYILTIIITGYGTLESATKAIRQGAYDYIQKPFKGEEIQVVIRNAAEKIRILRERTRLLEKLEEAHGRLKTLEARCKHTGENSVSPASRPAEDFNAYALFPRHTAPFSLFDAPRQDPRDALRELERLKDLKKEGVIGPLEFERLKRLILQNIGVEAS